MHKTFSQFAQSILIKNLTNYSTLKKQIVQKNDAIPSRN